MNIASYHHHLTSHHHSTSPSTACKGRSCPSLPNMHRHMRWTNDLIKCADRNNRASNVDRWSPSSTIYYPYIIHLCMHLYYHLPSTIDISSIYACIYTIIYHLLSIYHPTMHASILSSTIYYPYIIHLCMHLYYHLLSTIDISSIYACIYTIIYLYELSVDSLREHGMVLYYRSHNGEWGIHGSETVHEYNLQMIFTIMMMMMMIAAMMMIVMMMFIGHFDDGYGLYCNHDNISSYT